MTADRLLYVTTAIPYVNARPHLGFAFEIVLADVIARHARRKGRAVRFVSGTDENSLKNALAAERAGAALGPFVAENAEAFRALGAALGASYDDFVRTGVDPRHRAAVEALWAACRHDFYRGRYRGLYCAGCEAFRDLDEGASCPEHAGPLEEVDEENWFFRLSRHERAVRDALERTAGTGAAAREVGALLERGLRDVSVSRD
ncbi:MAG TPA: class I tRNA ligase family protein, partial [Polyangiaceae bacterium]|nr:class I tRNA ligase family protein [Polyangiaceae bacterium]